MENESMENESFSSMIFPASMMQGIPIGLRRAVDPPICLAWIINITIHSRENGRWFFCWTNITQMPKIHFFMGIWVIFGKWFPNYGNMFMPIRQILSPDADDQHRNADWGMIPPAMTCEVQIHDLSENCIPQCLLKFIMIRSPFRYSDLWNSWNLPNSIQFIIEFLWCVI